jgi:two-component system, sensor histidine kinase and response regulator
MQCLSHHGLLHGSAVLKCGRSAPKGLIEPGGTWRCDRQRLAMPPSSIVLRTLLLSAATLLLLAPMALPSGAGTVWLVAAGLVACVAAAAALLPARRASTPPPPAPTDVPDAAFYRVLAEHLPASLVVFAAADGRVLHLNRQAEQEFGLRRDAVLGRTSAEVFGPAVAQQVEPALRKALAGHTVVEEELALRIGEAERIVNARFLATWRADGTPEALVVIARDVSAERAAQLALEDSRLQWQAFAAAVDEGVFVAAPGRARYHYVSAHALELLGLTAEQLADPLALPQRVHAEDRQAFAAAAQREAQGEAVDLTFRFQHPECGQRWLRLRTRTRAAPSGESRLSGLISDVTLEREHEVELKRARDAADAASRAKSQFMTNMSHEIRTPMNGVLGMTELLLGTPLSDRQRRFAQAVYRSGESLLEVINDILDFSKIESGKLELAPLDFVLRGVVEDTLELLAPRAHEKKVELSFREQPGLPSLVHADSLRLRQVITNLVANAIKFTERGEVVVGLKRLDAALPAGDAQAPLWLEFSVRDTGIGIQPNVLPRLFSAFEQASGGMARRYGGTGLGLAISKQLVEAMGGRIEVESQPGIGSCFRFALPVAPASPAALELDADVLELPPMRVLVVEDHETNRIILESMLSGWGMQVVVAEDGLRALEILRGRTDCDPRFDLALVDMRMPGLDGIGLARTLRASPLHRKLKLIMLSSVCAPDDVRSALLAGYDRFVSKPLRRAELRQAIGGVLQAIPHEARLRPALGHQILVVEDNVVNQELISQMLRDLGARVRVASGALEGLRALGEERFDMVLMDIQMPGMDGTEALHWFRRGNSGRFQFVTPSDIPVVAVTANALAGDAERFVHLGFDDYLSKPFRQSQLHTMLKRHLKIAAAAPVDPQGDPLRPGAAQGSGADAGAASNETDRLAAALKTVLDAAALERLLELDPGGRNGLLSRVLRAFDGAMQRLLQQLHEARASCDQGGIHHVAHTLKSSSASIGALELSRICADIERRTKSKEAAAVELDALVDQMVAESHRIMNALKPLLES